MNAPVTCAHGDYALSDDPVRLDLEAMHRFLREAYWSRGLPRAVLARAVAGSLCIGAYEADGAQVGFARFVTDCATFCYVCDVYVLDAHRGKGLARAMLDMALAHPRLQGLRRWMLVTRDAHTLYEGCGFTPLAHPERHLEKSRPDFYLR
ncbi:MAG TPA: GNAT family N-acetyltransferase [Steroidobacteraceae bacterium]|nr:GNAT family N-acetyltransferase [Steroidobacteraceae bacterium]